MTFKQKMKTSSIVIGLVGGIFAAMVIMVVVLMITSMLISCGKIDQMQGTYGVNLALLMASFVGAIVASIIIKRKQKLMCFLCGTGFMVLLMLTTIVCFNGIFENILVTSLVIIAGCGAAGFIKFRNKGIYYKRQGRHVRSR